MSDNDSNSPACHHVWRNGVTGHDPSKRYCIRCEAVTTPTLAELREAWQGRITETATCWIWTGWSNSKGYGMVRRGTGKAMAHRLMYESVHGPIPAGLHVDHLCRITNCVNPDHLEAVTPRENTIRGVNPAAMNARKTHCDNGHEFDPLNTHMTSDGNRRCRACHKLSCRQYNQKHREQQFHKRRARIEARRASQ